MQVKQEMETKNCDTRTQDTILDYYYVGTRKKRMRAEI